MVLNDAVDHRSRGEPAVRRLKLPHDEQYIVFVGGDVQRIEHDGFRCGFDDI